MSHAQELSWQVQHPVSKKWIPFGKKGSVQEAFIAAKLMPDPFVGTNETQFAWFENFTWKLRSNFILSEEMKAKRFVELDLPSVDTYAKIFVNDVELASTENAFVHYTFDIKRLLKEGTNVITIVFTPPILFHKDKMKQIGTVLPAPNDVGKVQVAPLCRKPQYQFGWDWSLRMVTMGFWEPVSIVSYSGNRVLQKQLRTILLTDELATERYSFRFAQPLNGKYFVESDLAGKIELQVLDSKEINFNVNLNNPKLWWPRGHGEQFLYEDHIRIKNELGEIVYDSTLHFGLKKVELIQEKDQWGTSFLFKINGRPIFCKGADYIPDDIFPARISDSLLRSRVQTMANCNFNMIRIWGGGMYPKESFLEECDRKGIMVWQDFMFACAMYPGTDAFLSNVKQEIEQQISRISSHASLVYFNGNNEVDVAWHNWGFQQTYNLSKSNERLIESYYKKLFQELIPETVERLSEAPYVHTSPLSNWGKEEFYRDGTQHYWGVWHGKDPLEDFSRKAGRFNAEYGFQSFPEFSTLSKFSTKADWSLMSKVMKHHQKSYVGNAMIAKHATVLFGTTDDFMQFVYLAQLTQAKAVSMAVVSHRTSFPRTSGTLYWQMNDCWPAPSWSSLDYYGQWKALQYQVRDDYRESAIVAKIDTLNKEKYWFVEDTYAGYNLSVSAVLFNEKGEVLDTLTCHRAVIGPQAFELFTQEIATINYPFYALKFSWNTASGEQVARVFIHEEKTNKRIKSEQPSFSRMAYNPETRRGKFRLSTQETLVDLWITHPDLAIQFDKNFETLLPGSYEIEFYSPEIFELTDLLFYYR